MVLARQGNADGAKKFMTAHVIKFSAILTFKSSE